MKLSRQLKQLHACKEAYKWVGKKTLKQAWATCERGDWMLWYAAKVDIDRKLLVKAACACARLALPYLPSDELRPARAIETAERWIDGGATVEEVRNAAEAARATADAYAAAAAAYTTTDAAAASAYDTAAAYAAEVARATADAYAAAADAAAAAAYTTTDAAAASAYAADAYAAEVASATAAAYARNIISKKCSDIVRAIIPVEMLEDK